MNHFRHGITRLGILDCRSKQFLPGQAAKALMRLGPTIDSPGNRDAVNAIMWHGSNAMLGKKLDGKFSRRPATGIETIKLAAFGVPIKEKEVAPNAIHHGLSHAEHRIGGD